MMEARSCSHEAASRMLHVAAPRWCSASMFVTGSRQCRRTVAARAIAALAGPSTQQSVVITGASTGIGAATALALANKGWRVFAGVRSAPAGQALLLRLQQASAGAGNAGAITPLLMDVTKNDTLLQAAEAVGAAVGAAGLQGCICNAGKAVLAPTEYFPLQAFEDVLDTNLTGVLRTSQAFLPLLRKGQKKGRIINVSSVAGSLPLPLWSAYCSSKAALDSLTDCMRYELAPQGIPVVLIKPGPVKTPIWGTSRAATDSLIGGLPAEAQERYSGLVTVMDAMVQQSEDDGIPCQDVVQVLIEALTAPNPKTRYILGSQAAPLLAMKRLLPEWTFDFLLTTRLKF